MILVLLQWGKDALSSQVKKDNCWSEQSPEKSIVLTVPFFVGHPVYIYMYEHYEPLLLTKSLVRVPVEPAQFA